MGYFRGISFIEIFILMRNNEDEFIRLIDEGSYLHGDSDIISGILKCGSIKLLSKFIKKETDLSEIKIDTYANATIKYLIDIEHTIISDILHVIFSTENGVFYEDILIYIINKNLLELIKDLPENIKFLCLVIYCSSNKANLNDLKRLIYIGCNPLLLNKGSNVLITDNIQIFDFLIKYGCEYNRYHINTLEKAIVANVPEIIENNKGEIIYLIKSNRINEYHLRCKKIRDMYNAYINSKINNDCSDIMANYL